MKFKSLAITTVSVLSLAAISIPQVNEKVTNLLKPFNNSTTSSKIEFKHLNINTERALDFQAILGYKKSGEQNTFALNMENIEYHYGDGQNPKLNFAGSIELDLIRALGQPFINEMAAHIADISVDLSKQFMAKYGNAVKIDAAVDELKKDEQNNVESVKMHFTAQIDSSQLPNDLKPEDVEFKTLSFAISATRKNMGINGHIIMNPLYKSFRRDQVGLKEFIEGLLNEDAQVYSGLQEFISMIDDVANEIVNRKPEGLDL